MKHRPSPNFNDRAENIDLSYIVLHYTGMRNAAEAFTRLCDPATEVSAHYVIEENGAITQLVDESQRAWHAGHSYWRGIRDLNSASIGIELVNPGHEYGYHAFPDDQIAALESLLPHIAERRKMLPATCLLAHSDIAPTRKKDPGELFPWQRLAQQGFGLWPDPDGSDFESAHSSDAPDLLTVIGYDASNISAAVKAFQRRYHPENISGIAGPHTIARLRALNRILPPQSGFPPP